jgi:hypothetical protein
VAALQPLAWPRSRAASLARAWSYFPRLRRRRGASAFPGFLLCHQALNLLNVHEQARIRPYQHALCGFIAGAFRIQ